MISRGKLLALVAPGALALNVTATPGTVDVVTGTAWPRMASAVPGCNSSRVDRLAVLAPKKKDYFSTKARSIT